MKKTLAYTIILLAIFGTSFAHARNNMVVRYSTSNVSNKVEYSIGDKYSNTSVQVKEQAKEDLKAKKENIRKQIQEKQKQIIYVKNKRGSSRAIEAEVNQIKSEIKCLQKELETLK